MKVMDNPRVVLKESINHDEYALLWALQEKCVSTDNISLKLELDYKLNASPSAGTTQGIGDINEFMYFSGNELIGYVGLASFGGTGAPIEATGMVHPEFRRQGVFKRLVELVMEEWKRRASGDLLLLCDRESKAGQQFIATTGAQYRFSEFEMRLERHVFFNGKSDFGDLSFRQATPADAAELARQDAVYFGTSTPDINLVVPEKQEQRGQATYLAEKSGLAVGKVRIEFHGAHGMIYGLGVLPNYRRMGFGRALLLLAIDKLRDADLSDIVLQVATHNEIALGLYKSCGFRVTSIMDYFGHKFRH